ncbi:hypothetical protein M422DRAFT_93614, partial [Sphaerobolus stellatus SS14]
SHLRLHCTAKERLLKWQPIQSCSTTAGLSEEALKKVLVVLMAGWATGTLSTYASDLLLFHLFCDEHEVQEQVRCPVDPTMLLAFVAACAGHYSGSTISNSVHAVRAWHMLHGARWAPSCDELAAVLNGATRLAPSSSKRAQQDLWIVEMICKVCFTLDPENPFDIAFYSALTTIFWTMSHSVELLVYGVNNFSLEWNITHAGIKVETNGEGIPVMVFSLPWTKVSQTGEKVFWARQNGPADTYAALLTHIHVNNPPVDKAFFSWRCNGDWKVLTKAAFIKRMELAAAEAGLPKMHGHGLCIGSVLEYLTWGLSFEQVKHMGHWKGESFALYLRKHAVVLAPYIQAVP